MHDVETEVRELLQERSEDIGLDPRIPYRVVSRSHRRRVLMAGAAGLGAAALALVVVAGFRALSIPEGKTPVTESPTRLDEGMPPSFVGLRDGELVLASTETGEVLRVIADRSVVGTDDAEGDLEPPVRPALTPDRSAVYFSTFHFRSGSEDRRLVRVPLEGGEPEDLGPGADPAVSPDGDRLAYRACSEDGCGHAVVILDLGTGEETRVESGHPDLQVGESVWLPDGRLVVDLLPPMDRSPAGAGYHVIDPSRPPADLVHAPLVPTPLSTQRFGSYGYDSQTGGFIVGQQRIKGRVGGAFQPGNRLRYVSVDPDTGAVLATVETGGWLQVHANTPGQNLLLLDFRDRVYVARVGGEPQLIADGFSDVAW